MPPTSQHGTPRLLICTDALVKCCGLYAHVKGCLQLKPTSQCCCTLQVQALVQPVPSAVGRGAANATLAAALSAGVFYAPSSPPPVPKRPDTEVTAFAVLPTSKNMLLVGVHMKAMLHLRCDCLSLACQVVTQCPSML